MIGGLLKTQNNAHANFETLIGKNTRVQGNVKFTGGLHLDGVIEGDVSVEDNKAGSLSISEHGYVKGKVNVTVLMLNGKIDGDVIVKERVSLAANARVNGNLHYKLIEMSVGASVNGQLAHHDKPHREAITKL